MTSSKLHSVGGLGSRQKPTQPLPSRIVTSTWATNLVQYLHPLHLQMSNNFKRHSLLWLSHPDTLSAYRSLTHLAVGRRTRALRDAVLRLQNSMENICQLGFLWLPILHFIPFASTDVECYIISSISLCDIEFLMFWLCLETYPLYIWESPREKKIK